MSQSIAQTRQAWWVELALIEYLEILFFRDNARSLVWWPKVRTKTTCTQDSGSRIRSKLYSSSGRTVTSLREKSPIVKQAKCRLSS